MHNSYLSASKKIQSNHMLFFFHFLFFLILLFQNDIKLTKIEYANIQTTIAFRKNSVNHSNLHRPTLTMSSRVKRRKEWDLRTETERLGRRGNNNWGGGAGQERHKGATPAWEGSSRVNGLTSTELQKSPPYRPRTGRPIDHRKRTSFIDLFLPQLTNCFLYPDLSILN